MDIIKEKKQIRKLIKELNLQYDRLYKDQASNIIFDKIENLKEFQNAKNLLLYWSDNYEVNTHNFIVKWYKLKNIYLPTIISDTQMEFRLFEGIEKMKFSQKFKILEPIGQKIDKIEIINIAIIPGIAFDVYKNRMGRGKGFYDNFLKNKKFFKVGICFDYQILNKIPVDTHDIKMDIIISEKREIV